MPITLDLSADHAVYDNFEPIRYQSFLRIGDVAFQEEQFSAKRRVLTRREMDRSGGAYTAADLVWLIWEEDNAAAQFTPKPGDQVLDGDDAAWTVLETVRSKFRQTHKLICRNLAIAFGLGDKITIELAEQHTQASIAATTRTWAPLIENLLVRVQPQEEEIKDERSVLGGSARYTVFLSRQLRLDNLAEVRVKWVAQGHTHYLDVERYHTADQIGELPRLEVVRRV